MRSFDAAERAFMQCVRYQEVNGMTSKDIVAIWAHIFIRKPEGVEKNSEDAQNNAVKHIEITEMIINYFHSKATRGRISSC